MEKQKRFGFSFNNDIEVDEERMHFRIINESGEHKITFEAIKGLHEFVTKYEKYKTAANKELIEEWSLKYPEYIESGYSTFEFLVDFVECLTSSQ